MFCAAYGVNSHDTSMQLYLVDKMDDTVAVVVPILGSLIASILITVAVLVGLDKVIK